MENNEEERKKLYDLIGLGNSSSQYIKAIGTVFDEIKQNNGPKGHCIDSGNYAMLCHQRDLKLKRTGFNLNYATSPTGVIHSYTANTEEGHAKFLLINVVFSKNIGLRDPNSTTIEYVEETVNWYLSNFKDNPWINFSKVFLGYVHYLQDHGYKCKAILIRDGISLIFLNPGQDHEEVTLNFCVSNFTSYK